jgi:chemosensory pili system protein ChpA (sensor histidine kinase/response regulator)
VHENGEGAAVTEAALTAAGIIDSRPANSVNPYAVIDYVAANEPPVDEEAFDQYLLRGEHLVSVETDVEDLVVDGTEGIVSVDPQMDSAIDYHEDFSVKDDDLPILEITGNAPPALSSLSQGEIDAIYIRLSNSADDSICNKLFSEESMAPNALDPATIDISESLAGGIEQDHDASGFGEDIFSADITEELVGSTDLTADDFEFSCEDIGFEEDILAADSGDTLDSVFDEEVFSVGFDDETVDGIELDTPENIAETFPETEEETKVPAVFEEDIFSSDLVDDFGAAVETSAVDVDAMINALADIETDTDEICGVAVDEFATSDLGTSESAEQETVEPEDVSGAALETEEGDLSWCIPAQITFSYTSQSVAEVFTDFLDAFIEEGASELEKLEDAMAEWEKDVRSDAAFEPIPRVLHTLKGIAKGIGLQRYGTLIHNFETLLESLERPVYSQERSYFCIVNAWLEAAVRGLEHIEAERTDVLSELPTQLKAPVEELKAAETDTAKKTSSAAVSPVGQQAAVADRRKEQQLADEGAKTLAAQQTIRMTPEALDHLLSLTNEAQQLGVRSSQSTVRSKHAAAELLSRLTSVRAHVSKIADRALFNVTAKGGRASSEMDALEMDQYSELQEAANILREGVEDLDDLIHLSSRQNTIAEALLKQQASTISTLGASIQAARVVPVSRLMPGLRRIVRNVSADLGKSVTFRVLNEIGSLDRDNHARCQIVLEHMIRNALDHGIESPEARMVRG